MHKYTKEERIRIVREAMKGWPEVPKGYKYPYRKEQ